MKIKTDFITNSSSSNYILLSDEKFENFYDLNFNAEYSAYDNKFECFEDIKQLISFTQGRECDWCDLVTGPKSHWNYYSPEWYSIMEKLLTEKKKKYVYYAKVERSDTDNFEYALKKKGVEIIEVEYE